MPSDAKSYVSAGASSTAVVLTAGDESELLQGDMRRTAFWRFGVLGTYGLRALIWLLISGFLCGAVLEGLRLRVWLFQISDPIRFIFDPQHGVYWGLQASGPEGLLNQYEKMDPEVPEWKDSRWDPWLDYNPLRLLVMRQWGAWQRIHYPPDPKKAPLDEWQRSYEFNAPALHFNTGMELFAAVCAFFLTRHWVIRGSTGEARGHFLGVWQGIMAAMILWFSPDLLLNGHAWPQWDGWIVPCYLCACLLASWNWWFAAGMAFSIGGNLKGQMFAIAPIFIIWPLIQGRIGAAVRWMCGMGFCYALITSPWLVSYIPPDRLAAAREIQRNLAVLNYPPTMFAIPRTFDLPAVMWIAGMLLAAALVPWLLRVSGTTPAAIWAWLWSRAKRFFHSSSGDALGEGAKLPRASMGSVGRWKALWRHGWTGAGAAAIMAVTYWPWLLERNRGSWRFGLLAGAAVAAGAMLLPRRGQKYLLATVATGGLFACIWLFHGSSAWWDCGVRYGSIHWPYMSTGPVCNMPTIFWERFGWDMSAGQIAFTLPAFRGHWPHFIASRSWWPASNVKITSKMLFDSIYGILLVVSGIGIGLQTRRNDRRALIAFATPWILFFLWPVQIQERYLLFASGASVCCIGNGVGTALMGFLWSIFSLLMTLKCMLTPGWVSLDLLGQNLSRDFPLLFSPESGHTIRRYLDALQPDMTWAILLLSLIFLYLSVMPSGVCPLYKPHPTLTGWDSAAATDPAASRTIG